MEIEYEPRLVEEAVLRAVARRPEGRLFYREREQVYRIADAEERGLTFDRLSLRWFARLGLEHPLRRAFEEQPLVTGGVGRCGVGCAARRQDAGAELLVRRWEAGEPEQASRRLCLLVEPDLLLEPDRLLAFARRELQHVADMLDPRFGYAPELPSTSGPGYQRLVRERYRVVWNTSVDGRLARAGRIGDDARGERQQEFRHAFAALGDEAEVAFARFFNGPVPTHADILAFVLGSSLRSSASPVCPLCGCATAGLEAGAAAFAPQVLAEIVADFPGWRPADGCCPQCADLYRARRLSLAGAAALPGIG